MTAFLLSGGRISKWPKFLYPFLLTKNLKQAIFTSVVTSDYICWKIIREEPSVTKGSIEYSLGICLVTSDIVTGVQFHGTYNISLRIMTGHEI